MQFDKVVNQMISEGKEWEMSVEETLVQAKNILRHAVIKMQGMGEDSTKRFYRVREMLNDLNRMTDVNDLHGPI